MKKFLMPRSTSLLEFFAKPSLQSEIKDINWKTAYLQLYMQNKPKKTKSLQNEETQFQIAYPSLLRNPFSKHIHSIPMFGEGLEGGSAKNLLYTLMYSENSPFKITGLYPGVEGIGSGVGFNVNGVKISLSAMYKYEDRGVFDKVRPLWSQFFKNASGFIFVVDIEQDIQLARDDLNSFIGEAFGVSSDAPLLILAILPKGENSKKTTPMEIAQELDLHEGEMKVRKWCVRVVSKDKLDDLWEGIEWLTTKI